jgi:shikimate kinase
LKLALIGLRGTGKSTVGKILAERLKWAFYDTDTLVQERAGTTIRELFEKMGEGHFRKLESEVVQQCCGADNAVLATGGGAILDPRNVEALRRDGFVIHLSADPTELWRRISRDRATHDNRPQLVKDASSGIDELKLLLRSRAAAYAQARHAEVIVEGRSPDEVADAVLVLMRAHGKLGASQ